MKEGTGVEQNLVGHFRAMIFGGRIVGDRILVSEARSFFLRL